MRHGRYSNADTVQRTVLLGPDGAGQSLGVVAGHKQGRRYVTMDLIAYRRLLPCS